MKLNIFRSKQNDISKFDVSSFIKELTERLKKMDRELVIDRFEGDFAVCEDRKTKEIYNINVNELPNEIKEGSILKYVDGKYVIDKELEEDISDRISKKMDDLWN